ncbi:MAG: hypothetical protein MH472_11545 [Bacteroidia bacterium]|nr:hypothetical protein [Bacteroidia bacterium]
MMHFLRFLFGLNLFLFSFFTLAQLPKPVFEKQVTPDYMSLVQQYEKLAAQSPYMQLKKAGLSDAGNFIHLLIIDKQQQFLPNQSKKPVMLIMNGIHPGETEGIDASLLMLEAFVKNPKLIPDSVTLLIIPCYNVDGMINRKHYTRANQNGPDEKGFRASANNLDLNRDFIKADSKNTFVFYSIFQEWQPHVFVDTHTSNGADYQYTMTLISSQNQKLGGPAAEFMYGKMNPFLYSDMKKKGFEMAPYVTVFGKSPDEAGYDAFVESPKYSTGYAALFGCLGFVAETHMLKPYPQRVKATYHLIESFLVFTQKNASELVRTKEKQLNWMWSKTQYPSNFEINKNYSTPLLFKGYTLEKHPSKLGNYERHFYNKNRPFEKPIPYYDSANAKALIEIPEYFIVKQEWKEVIERLKANKINRIMIDKPQTWEVQAKYIYQINYAKQPYEGHFVHQNIACSTQKASVDIQPGDWLIPVKQAGIWYLMEALSPETWDGFMHWNFFDPILNEKEGFSDYAFEDDAIAFLEERPELKKAFEQWKSENPDKVSNKYEVLGFIYKNSPYREKEFRRFPVYFKNK